MAQTVYHPESPANFTITSANFREYLHERAVFDEEIDARGYCWVNSGKPIDGRFASVFGFPHRAGGILIPLHPLLGGEAFHLRDADPQLGKDGKALKFLTPSKQPNCLITSPLIDKTEFQQERADIVIVEGITRVDALAHYGIPALGITGVWNWRGRNPVGGKTAIADWEEVSIEGSNFLLAPDGDVSSNPDVYKAIERLQKFLLAKRAANVVVLELPDNQGLDDWIAGNGPFEDKKALFVELKPHVLDDMPPEPVSKQSKQAMTQGLPILDDADAMGNWSCNPTADAVRLLRYAPDKLLAARNRVDGTWRLLVDNGFGVWHPDAGSLDRLMVKSSSEWNTKIATSGITGNLTTVDAQKAIKWAIESTKPRGRADCRFSIGAAVELLKAADQLPAGLEQCDAFDLDRHSPDAPVLGTPNGVIDLNTGQLLPREEGRKRFVSRSVPDEFQPDAQHKMVDDLIAHLPEAERDYILAAVGFALRRIPARRMYLLVGQKRSGKTTFLNAVYGCLGDVKNNGYGMSLDVRDLAPPRFITPNSHSGGLFGIQDAAIAIVSEAPQEDKVTFNERLIRSLTGGDVQNMRDVGEKSGSGRPASATIVMALNPDQLPGISLRDEALRDRIKIMDYPPLELAEADVDDMRIEAVRDNPAVRQALLALLVKAGVERAGKPPQDTETVTAAVALRYAESIGPVGEWLIANVSRAYGKRLYTNDLWEAVVAEFGPEKDCKIEDRTRRETIALFRTVIGGLPGLESKGRKSHYLGLTLAPAPAAEDWPLCVVCAENPVSPGKESQVCSQECLVKALTVSGGVDGEAARDAVIHRLVVNTGRDCHTVDNGIVHYGIGPDWTHCYCGKYQRPEKAGKTFIDGQPSPEWVLHVSDQPPDERQASLDGMPAPTQPYH